MPRGVRRKDPAARPALALGMPEKFIDALLNLLSVDEDELTYDTTLADLGADSLDCVELTMVLEEAFKVALNDEVTESWERATLKVMLDDLKHAGAKI